MALNKQPVFTATPRNEGLNAANYGTGYPAGSPQTIFTDSSTYGTMINRVTITPSTVSGSATTENLFSLSVGDYGVVKTGYIAAGTIGISNQPSLVFTFSPALVLSTGQTLKLASSNNTDSYYVLVEGATYDV
jgi:hypothetical protein